MKRALLLLLASACGDNTRLAPDAAPIACTAMFSGNFSETAKSDSCAHVTGTTISLAIPSLHLAPSVDATFTLAHLPSPGTYAPATVSAWQARGVEQRDDGVCLYAAGDAATPTGAFELRLDTVDRTSAHGSLMLLQSVLPFAGTTCGTDDTELIQLTF